MNRRGRRSRTAPAGHRRVIGVAVALSVVGLLQPAQAQQSAPGESKPPSVFELTLDELMDVKVLVPAALTRLTRPETPAAITVITASDIRHTPARNIYDLLEAYVPGAIWLNSEEGPLLGVRGSIVDRNYRYLLLINGRLVNSKAHYGAKSELEQWSLGDIRRIEVIRGPGSVTYGPGAVAGVISIITHDAGSDPDEGLALDYVGEYAGKGVSVAKKLTAGEMGIYGFASLRRTRGSESRQFLVDGDEFGFIGEQIMLDTPPMEYFADYQDEPQVKLHLDATLGERWRLWIRYGQEGSTWRSNEAKTDFAGVLRNQQSVRDRLWTASIEHDASFGEAISVSSLLSLDSFDAERRQGPVRHPDPDHALNKKVDFSESDLLLRSVVNWRVADEAEVAVGAEYSRDRYGPGWGDREADMRLGDNGIIVNAASSNAIDPSSGGSADDNGTAVFVGDGWSTNGIAFFTEANLSPDPRVRLLISARADKSTHSQWLVSPRVALVAQVGERQHVRLVGQQSRRLNTAGQVLTEFVNGRPPSHETMTSMEIGYWAQRLRGLSYGLTGYWTNSEVIAWDGELNSIKPVGDLKVAGLEAELEYRSETTRLGASYSFAKQLHWRLAPGVTRSGISYSDYDQPLRDSDAIQVGFGNDLNNWPNHGLKLYFRTELTGKLTIHADAQVFWSYRGVRDGIEGLRRAVAGLPEEQPVAEVFAAVEGLQAYAAEFRADASLLYDVDDRASLRVYGQNLLGARGNKRYAYDSGNDRPALRRVRFIEEPRSLGVRLELRF